MDIASWVSVVSAFVAVVGVVVGLVRLRVEHTTQVKQWAAEHKVAIRIDFLRDLVSRRLDTYSAVFATLGAVRDYPRPTPTTDTRIPHATTLKTACDELLVHLYGPAGLVMRQLTRDALVAVWETTNSFLGAEPDAPSAQDVVDVFYEARRRLREDLQMLDYEDKEVDSVRSIIGTEFSDGRGPADTAVDRT